MPDSQNLSLSPEIRIARIISAIFNPLLIPGFSFLILYSIKAYFTMLLTGNARLLILAIVFINTCVFPALLLVVLRRSNIISSYSLGKRQDRIYPLIAASLLYYITYFLFRRLNIPSVYLIFMLGGAISSVIALIITYYYKISLHMMALGGLLGALVSISFNLALHNTFLIGVVIIVSGLTGSSRILLDAHKPHQVYSGFLMGFLIMFLVFMIL